MKKALIKVRNKPKKKTHQTFDNLKPIIHFPATTLKSKDVVIKSSLYS